MKEKVRVASGQGFWGDLLTAPVDQVRGGPIDYLMLDYLAEVTMSIVQKQRARDPEAGYAKDFITMGLVNVGIQWQRRSEMIIVVQIHYCDCFTSAQC
jgi:hypothetical protein